jgi:hypothetical protein
MEISKLSYKFKICVTLKDYTRALVFLESFSNSIEDVTLEDVILFKALKKGILKQYTDYLKTLQSEVKKSNKFSIKNVVDDYSSILHNFSINIIESFINSLNILLNKVVDFSLRAILLVIRAKLFVFISQYKKDEKGRFITMAYASYKTAIELAFKYMPKKDLFRMKIFYSYCKFTWNIVNDKYRSVLFCINVIDELNSITLHENENEDEPEEHISSNPEFQKILSKFKLFYGNNLEEYNKKIRVYHPEYN